MKQPGCSAPPSLSPLQAEREVEDTAMVQAGLGGLPEPPACIPKDCCSWWTNAEHLELHSFVHHMQSYSGSNVNL